MKHECPEELVLAENELYSPGKDWSFWHIYLMDGTLTEIKYCPWCGVELPKEEGERMVEYNKFAREVPPAEMVAKAQAAIDASRNNQAKLLELLRGVHIGHTTSCKSYKIHESAGWTDWMDCTCTREQLIDLIEELEPK